MSGQVLREGEGFSWHGPPPRSTGRKLGFSYLWHHLLETQEEDLQPYPSQQQQDDHGGEGKTKPGGKVDHVAILGEEPEEEDMGYCVTLSLKLPGPISPSARAQVPIHPFPHPTSGTHELTWPWSTRLGVVPVRVAMPPMLAE